MKIYNINSTEWRIAKIALTTEVVGLHINHHIVKLLRQSIHDFEDGRWDYDGATFVRERFKTHCWEVAAFIHDWRNSMGYVGSKPDQEMFAIMNVLGYKKRHITIRKALCNFTFLNTIRHFLKGSLASSPPDIPFFTLKTT